MSPVPNIDPMCQWVAEKLILGLSVIVTVLLLYEQLRKNREAERKNKVDELHLEIYRDISAKTQIGMQALSVVSSYIEYEIPEQLDSNRFILDEFAKVRSEKDPQLEYYKGSVDSLAQDFHAAKDNIFDVLFSFEKYEIALPEFSKIKEKIMSESIHLEHRFQEYLAKVVPYLPIVVPDNEKEMKELTPKTPQKEEIAAIKDIADKYRNIRMDITCSLYDLTIEAQNSLLSGLFKKKLKLRSEEAKKSMVVLFDVDLLSRRIFKPLQKLEERKRKAEERQT